MLVSAGRNSITAPLDTGFRYADRDRERRENAAGDASALTREPAGAVELAGP